MSELVKELRKIASDGLLTAPLMIPFHYASLAADEIESLLARIAELERTDMDKMRAQAIADADDLTALVERPAADVISVRGFESVLSTFRTSG